VKKLKFHTIPSDAEGWEDIEKPIGRLKVSLKAKRLKLAQDAYEKQQLQRELDKEHELDKKLNIGEGDDDETN